MNYVEPPRTPLPPVKWRTVDGRVVSGKIDRQIMSGDIYYVPSPLNESEFSNRLWREYLPAPEINWQALCAQHENELAVHARALRMAQSKIARLEAEIARLRPSVVAGLSRGEVLARALRADPVPTAYGR